MNCTWMELVGERGVGGDQKWSLKRVDIGLKFVGQPPYTGHQMKANAAPCLPDG